MSTSDGESWSAPDLPGAGSLLAAIVASSTDAIIGKDLTGTVTSWDEAAERLFGFKADEMIGQPIQRVIPPARIMEEAAILDRISRGERMLHFETERVVKDGRLIPVSLSISPVHDASGAVVGASKTVRDLSGPRRLNDVLHRREAILQSILDTVPHGLIVISPKGTVQSFSPAAERMFGYAASEVLGQNVSLLMPEPDRTAHAAYLRRYLATGERRIVGIGRVVVAQRRDGTHFPIELQIGEVLIPGLHLFTAFARDLTERHERERRLAELQAELIHAGRLSELGRIASALAHEVNQPLAAIGNYVAGMRHLLSPDHPAALREAVDKIGRQAERARLVLRSLRELVGKKDRPRQREDIGRRINQTAALVLIGASRSVTLDLRIAADAAHAFIDKVQIQQVLLNLMRNAIEAMAGQPSRTLTITATRRGARVDVTVADTGPGLPAAVRERLFQPFVTTKADGLGIGLSICRTIIEAHGGELVAADDRAGADGPAPGGRHPHPRPAHHLGPVAGYPGPGRGDRDRAHPGKTPNRSRPYQLHHGLDVAASQVRVSKPAARTETPAAGELRLPTVWKRPDLLVSGADRQTTFALPDLRGRQGRAGRAQGRAVGSQRPRFHGGRCDNAAGARPWRSWR